MRFPSIVFAALIVFGCSSPEGTPTGPSEFPPPAPPTPGWSATSATVWGMVFPIDGQFCITNAKVEVVQGQRTGETVTQEPCAYWDYVGGFRFENLTPGVEMTLRASAPGYVTKDFVITPIAGPTSVTYLDLAAVR